MSQKVKFAKMHGAGNDYIYVNTLLYNIENPQKTSIEWSNRHTGVGSDGLVLIGRPDEGVGADFSMRIFNADGSEAMMCGNASRCIGKYVYERGLTNKTVVRLQTLSGVKVLNLHVNEQRVVETVTVDMLEPRTDVPQQFDAGKKDSIAALSRRFEGTFVSMGNPHFVIFVDNADTIDVAGYGSVLENSEAFPERCNIEFATVVSPGVIRTRVWERGSGITMACGTGACATAVAAALTSHSGRESTIVMDGGELNVRWDETDGHVYMTGPAAFVFDGEIDSVV